MAKDGSKKKSGKNDAIEAVHPIPIPKPQPVTAEQVRTIVREELERVGLKPKPAPRTSRRPPATKTSPSTSRRPAAGR